MFLIIASHSKSRYKKGRNFNYIYYKEKMPTLARKKTFPSFSSVIGRFFYIFRSKKYGPNPSEMDIKDLTPAPTQ